MTKLSEHVKVEPSAMGGEEGFRKTHPAFGMLQFLRTSGGEGPFFGSEVDRHLTTFRMQLTVGQQEWHLHESRFFGSGTIVEVELTAAQFVQLLTTMNVGSGVPCTIRRGPLAEIREGGCSDSIPDIIDGDNTHEQMKEDLKASAGEAVKRVEALMASLERALEVSGLSQAKKTGLKEHAARVRQQLIENMPFLIDQYARALDRQKTAQLAEIDATIATMVQNLGMQSLSQMLEASKTAAVAIQQ